MTVLIIKKNVWNKKDISGSAALILILSVARLTELYDWNDKWAGGEFSELLIRALSTVCYKQSFPCLQINW